MVHWLGLGTFTVVAWVQFLAGELISHKLCGAAKDKTKNTKHKHTWEGWGRMATNKNALKQKT